MQDVLAHYLEVNFAEIAPRLGDPERLRRLIRELRRPDRAGPLTGLDLNEQERTVLDPYLKRLEEAPAADLAPPPDLAPDGSLAAEAAEPRAATSALIDPETVPAVEGQAVSVPAIESSERSRQPPVMLAAAAQLGVELLHVDAGRVYTIDEGRFVLRASLPPDAWPSPDAGHSLTGGLLERALERNEVVAVEDLRLEQLTEDAKEWSASGFRGFAAIAIAPPLERPVAVLALFRRSPWRLDRRDAVRLEDLALEVVNALRPNSLAARIEEVAAQQERIKLAREIHDGLASDLAAVVALLRDAVARARTDPTAAAGLLPELQAMSEEILTGARNILRSLRPNTVRAQGLRASVIRLVEQFGRSYLVESSVQVSGEENGLTSEEKEGIFQVLRESLSNVRRHAQARSVRVSLELDRRPWLLTIQDDGRGFEAKQLADDLIRSGSYGLLGMRERAALLDASLDIASRPGKGTVIVFSGPGDRGA
jgi:signal transduction histidine kinase